MSDQAAVDPNIEAMIRGLERHFGRLPTEDEVMGFVYGDAEQRRKTWNEVKE